MQLSNKSKQKIFFFHKETISQERQALVNIVAVYGYDEASRWWQSRSGADSSADLQTVSKQIWQSGERAAEATWHGWVWGFYGKLILSAIISPACNYETAREKLNVEESHPPFNLLSQFGRNKCRSDTWWLAARWNRKQKHKRGKRRKEKFVSGKSFRLKRNGSIAKRWWKLMMFNLMSRSFEC